MYKYKAFQIFMDVDVWICESHHLVTYLRVPDEEFTCDPFCLEPTHPPVHVTSSSTTAVIDFALSIHPGTGKLEEVYGVSEMGTGGNTGGSGRAETWRQEQKGHKSGWRSKNIEAS